MPKFKTFVEIESYFNNKAGQIMARSSDIERILSDAMNQAVWDVVYSAYNPKMYERRMDDDGLSDVRNMVISDFGINTNGEAFIIFENLAEGTGNLQGKLLTDTIVEGIDENFDRPASPYSDPRDFVGETVDQLRRNPEKLLEAFKKALSKNGLIVR